MLTISDLGETFSITSGSAYLDRYSSSFAASYPGAGNVNEQWQLYRAQEADYDVTITGVSEGETSVVLGGVRYAVDRPRDLHRKRHDDLHLRRLR